MNVHCRAQRDYLSTDPPLAVIVCRTDRGTHTGLLYFADDEHDRVILHLAFHRILQQERLDGDPPLWKPAVWATPAIDREMSEAVAALCRLVHRVNGDDGLPYSLKYIDQKFHIGTGMLELGPDSAGLTCASFVLALLNTYSVRLLRQEEWQLRPGDEEWQAAIIRFAQQNKRASPQHIAAMKREIGCARFRPTDIAAGAGSQRIPIGFDDATRDGAQIQDLLDSL